MAHFPLPLAGGSTSVLGPVYMEEGGPREERSRVAGHPTYHVFKKRDQIEIRDYMDR